MIKTIWANNSKAVTTGLIALALVAFLSTGSALAYFTTYAQALGGHPITLGTTTRLYEEYPQGGKDITIQNTGESPCFVRAKALTGDDRPVSFSGTDWYKGDADGNKSKNGEWWYYNKILNPGETTSKLEVRIKNLSSEDSDRFDVVVLHEATLASNAEGTAGDWSAANHSGN